MSTPERLPPSSPATPNGSPYSGSRQATSSNAVKLLLGGALLVMTCVSLFLSVTTNFSSIPDVFNTPHSDIPSLSKERNLESPWKIRERKPFHINLKRIYPSNVNEETKEDQKEMENKEESTKEEKKQEEVKIKKESPTEKKDDHLLHVSSKKQNTTEAKLRASRQKSTEKKPSIRQEIKEKVNERVKNALNVTGTSQQQQKAHAETKKDAKQDDATKKDTKKPLNILLLFADDWRHDSLGSTSNGLVKTPFLDNLATQGVRFTHNCVTTSVCWVSRATLYTGQYVSRHKSIEPMKPEFYQGWNQTFPHLLRKSGYYWGHVGKSFKKALLVPLVVLSFY